MNFSVTVCEVCDKPTTYCPPSPFSPCSYWRCPDCAKAKRIALWEFLCVLDRNNEATTFEEQLTLLNAAIGTPKNPFYASSYLLATIEFFGLSKTDAWNERKNWEKYKRNANGYRLHSVRGEWPPFIS